MFHVMHYMLLFYTYPIFVTINFDYRYKEVQPPLWRLNLQRFSILSKPIQYC